MSWMDYTTDGPGPGGYMIQSTIGKAPAFSLRGRHKESSKDAGPGPAQYDVTNGMKATKRSLPSFSLSSRTQTLDKKNVPGPGAYTVSDIVGKRRLLRSPSLEGMRSPPATTTRGRGPMKTTTSPRGRTRRPPPFGSPPRPGQEHKSGSGCI